MPVEQAEIERAIVDFFVGLGAVYDGYSGLLDMRPCAPLISAAILAGTIKKLEEK